MSIANEILRLQQAKSDLATSIENKGVTVPAATTLDGYASLVDQIQTGGLPYDAEVEYIEGDGASYINTDYYPTNNTSVEFKLRAKRATQAMGVCSVRRNCLFTIYQLGSNTTYAFRWQIGYAASTSGTYYNYQSNNSFDADYVFALRKNKFYLNDVLRNTFAEGTFTSTAALPLFAANTGSIDSRMFNGRIYYCKIWDGDTLVRDFIPVRIAQMGLMYDRISKRLFGNEGTGRFILGSDVNV